MHCFIIEMTMKESVMWPKITHRRWKIMIIGLFICVVIAFVSTWLAGFQHYVGAPMLGLLLGIVISNLWPVSSEIQKGTKFASGKLLKFGIILAGGTLSFASIMGSGVQALPLIVFNILLSIGAALFFGKRLGTTTNTGVLVGGGTAICGGTAIATLTSIIKAKEEEFAYAMAAIFFFDIFAAMMWPYAAVALQLSPEQFGILGGLAISDTASVTAAGVTYDGLVKGLQGVAGLTGGQLAVVVKLVRTTMLIFVAMGGVVWMLRRTDLEGEECSLSMKDQVLKCFPYFVLGFLALALAKTFGLIPSAIAPWLSKGNKFFITMALVGVGYKIKLKDIISKGLKPIALGGLTWLTVAASTLAYTLLFM